MTSPNHETIAPHGGKLIDRWVTESERRAVLTKAEGLPFVTLHTREISDLELIACGALSPLTGFMKKADYEAVVDRGRLANDLPWTLPITLSASTDQAETLKLGEDIALKHSDGWIMGTMTLREKYTYDKKREAERVYKTTEKEHPAVAYLFDEMGEVLLGGEVKLAKATEPSFPKYHNTPAATRKLFAERGWRRVVGFQTRNPVHRAHEYLQKCAMEVCDGLMLHPIVGFTKEGDIPADVRIRCYEVLLDSYYPADRVLLSTLPAAMRYGGPKEAIFHAIMRKNYGCTHFIVGRDHAGVGKYYGTYDAHNIFSEYAPEEMGITPLFFDHSFWCKRCLSMASSKTCSHSKEDHVFLSGTKVREMLQAGVRPPPEFSRPEVAQVLIDAMK